MFNKTELQIISKTMLQRREWLSKNINNPEFAAAKAVNQQMLEVIDSVLVKINAAVTAATPPVSHAAPQKVNKLRAVHERDIEPSRMRVLVVDDDEIIGTVLQALLLATGIKRVDVATDGLKGISMMYEAEPVYDLVLCDWNMPIKNGLDVHNAMRASERCKDTCFMLVTAVTEAKQIRAAIEEGVDDYIVKPIEEDKILKKIQRYFPKVVKVEES